MHPYEYSMNIYGMPLEIPLEVPFPHVHTLSGICGKSPVENFFPRTGLWKVPLFCPHPLWTARPMGPNGLQEFSTMFFPTAYYYELIPSSRLEERGRSASPLLPAGTEA